MSSDSQSTEVLKLLEDIINQIEVENNNGKCRLCLNKNVEIFEKISSNVQICMECYNSKRHVDLLSEQVRHIKRLKTKNKYRKDDDTNSQMSDEANNTDFRRITRNSVKQQQQQQPGYNKKSHKNKQTETFGQRALSINRRNCFFKQTLPKKCEKTTACKLVIEQGFVFYKGVYYKVGDIVVLFDEIDKKPYYAQICSLLNDEYAQKYAIITWLLPLSVSDSNEFDEKSFVLGPTEEYPRNYNPIA
jgi:hypothetical protein